MTLRNVRPFTTSAGALLCLGALSCAHAALIETDPPGAELYVDGTQVGITPYTMQDTVGGGDRYEIVLKKPGYKIVQETLVQDQFSWPRGVASIGCGVCTLGIGCLGLLWSWELQDRYSFVLEPLPAAEGGERGQPASAPAQEAPAEEEPDDQQQPMVPI